MRDRLTAGQIFELCEGEAPAIAESRVIVPGAKGKLFEADGSIRVAIIRPCVSRGKRINGLPPIYTPGMLSENAGVFTDWPMYQDHMAEQALDNFQERLAEARMGDVIEFLQERARRIKELGGRVEKSEWNPDITFEDDSEYGYQPGGIEGTVIPQRAIREMIEDDPKLLNVSINAWPSGARAGNAPWDSRLKGMLIEGIRRKPRGSVDWVFRGGAGGRLLLEDADLAVSVLEAYYAAEHGQGPLSEDDEIVSKLKELKPGELADYLREEAPHLLPDLKPEDTPGNGGGNGGGEGTALTEERLTEILDERDAEVDKRVQEREGARGLEKHALKLISEAERNGLPAAWAENLKSRYAVLPSGPSDSLKLSESDLEDDEGKARTPEQAIEARVREDVKECNRLIEAAGGRPAVRGLGAGGEDPNNEGGTVRKAPEGSTFREFLAESGDLQPVSDDQKLTEDEQVTQLVTKARS